MCNATMAGCKQRATLFTVCMSNSPLQKRLNIFQRLNFASLFFANACLQVTKRLRCHRYDAFLRYHVCRLDSCTNVVKLYCAGAPKLKRLGC